MSGEGVEVMVEGVRLGDRATEAAGDWGLGMRGDVGELFDELVGDGLVRCEGTDLVTPGEVQPDKLSAFQSS